MFPLTKNTLQHEILYLACIANEILRIVDVDWIGDMSNGKITMDFLFNYGDRLII